MYIKIRENQTNMVIMSRKVTREMLKKGYSVIDIKADRNDPDCKRSVFIFKVEGDFEKDINDCFDKLRKQMCITEQ